MRLFYFLGIFLLSCVQPIIAAEQFDIKADFAFMIDIDSGQVLYNKNGDSRTPTSSMSKMMTAYVVFDHLKSGKITLQDRFTTSQKAWKTEGSRMFLPLGSQVTVEDLLRGLIIQSGNDAATSLAENIMGSEESFAKYMNITAQKIGLNHSNFMNATGLPDENHYSTCRDLSTLAIRTIKDFPEYYGYYGEKQFTYNNISQPNRNRLLNMNVGADGLKTGRTDKAGFGITASATRNNRRLIVVTNGFKSDNLRTFETERLLNYGFANFSNILVGKKGDIIGKAVVVDGQEDLALLTSKEDIVATIPNYLLNQIKVVIEYEKPLIAPILKNQHVATLTIKGLEDEKSFPLIASQAINKSNLLVLWYNRLKAAIF